MNLEGCSTLLYVVLVVVFIIVSIAILYILKSVYWFKVIVSGY